VQDQLGPASRKLVAGFQVLPPLIDQLSPSGRFELLTAPLICTGSPTNAVTLRTLRVSVAPPPAGPPPIFTTSSAYIGKISAIIAGSVIRSPTA
jgi:hypothetical protein